MRENKRELPTTQANDESKREKDRTRLKSTITTVTNQTVTTGEPVRDPTRGSCSHTHTHTTLQGSASAGSTRAVHEAEATNSQHPTRSHPTHARLLDSNRTREPLPEAHGLSTKQRRRIPEHCRECRWRKELGSPFRSTSSSPPKRDTCNSQLPSLLYPSGRGRYIQNILCPLWTEICTDFLGK